MARSWASVASGPASAPAPTVLRADAPAWTPAPRCYYCGSAADICARCVRTQSYMPDWTLGPVIERGRCADHGGWARDHKFYNEMMDEFIPQTCSGCRAEHPWCTEDLIEVKGFSYEPMAMFAPLKSPNGGRFNVVFVSECRYIRLGQAKSSPEQVAAWAEAAYAKEMEFSGDKGRAAEIKKAVLENQIYFSMPFDLR